MKVNDSEWAFSTRLTCFISVWIPQHSNDCCLPSCRDWCSITSSTTHSIQLENEQLNKITRQLKPRNIFFLLFVNVNFKKSYLLYYTWRKALKVLESQCKMLGFFTSFHWCCFCKKPPMYCKEGKLQRDEISGSQVVTKNFVHDVPWIFLKFWSQIQP